MPVSPQWEVELIGDWGRARYLISHLPEYLREASASAMHAVSEKYRKELIKNIKTNRFGYDLSENYQFYKTYKGGDATKVLYWTGQYVRNIKVIRKRGRYYVTINPNARYQSGMHGRKRAPRYTIAQIAAINENGVPHKGISPKPVWKKTFKEMGGNKMVRQTFARSLSQRINERVRTL